MIATGSSSLELAGEIYEPLTGRSYEHILYPVSYSERVEQTSWLDEKIKRPSLIEKLLRALALQVGGEVSFRELDQLVGADNQTVEKYIDLMGKAEKSIFTTIRNAIINSVNLLTFRNVTGALWENFLMSERIH